MLQFRVNNWSKLFSYDWLVMKAGSICYALYDLSFKVSLVLDPDPSGLTLLSGAIVKWLPWPNGKMGKLQSCHLPLNKSPIYQKCPNNTYRKKLWKSKMRITARVTGSLNMHSTLPANFPRWEFSWQDPKPK